MLKTAYSKQTRIILMGALLSFLPLLLTVHPWFSDTLSSGWMAAPFVLFSLLIGYALIGYKFFDAEIPMRQILLCEVLAFVFLGSYQGLTWLTYEGLVWSVSRHSVHIVCAFAAILLAWCLNKPVQNLLDRYLYRQSFDPTAVYAQYLVASETLLERQALADLTLMTLQQTLVPLSATLTLNSPQGPVSFGAAEPGMTKKELTLEITFMGQVYGHLELGPQRSKLPYYKSTQAWLRKLLTQLAIRLYVLELSENQIQLSLETEQLEIKTHFLEGLITHLSHDLKSPLVSCHNLINKAVFLLKSGKTIAELNLERTFYRLLHCFTKLSEYISLSLDREILELGRLKLEQEAVDVTQACTDTLTLHEDFAQAKHVEVQWMAPDKPLYILGDRVRVEHVVSNLISNALKYCQKWVRLEIKATDQHVILSVQDDGPGIPPEIRPTLFELYKKVETPHSLMSSGLGLGICYQYISLMGGTIEVASSGAGSRFELCFPILEVPANLIAEGRPSVFDMQS